MLKNDSKEIAKDVIKSMKEVLGDAVSEIVISDVTNIPEKAFSIKFVLFDFYYMRFNYDKGHFGVSIVFGERGISINTKYGWDDECTYPDYWREVSEEVKLRIPDKFLERHGWK